ncbi:MAG TPA: T9SS type A sorting domain-containing protein [Bacteroidota bacterium]|nr:T9SS type A sorting domain-containing protein [Bacteroidota bacterium]
MKRAILLSLTMTACLLFCGWGRVGHAIINGAGARDFPDRTILTPTLIQQLTDSASVPDSRSGSPTEPKHFMDMEDVSGFSTHTITHNRDSLFLMYGEPYIRNTVGMLPWVIDSVMTKLTSQFRANDWYNAWRSAGDLGHYVGDAHQPLHATTYYNGYASKYGSGSNGVHSRYETNMITSYQPSIHIDSVAVHLIPSPLDTVFDIMYHSNSLIDSVYIADQIARSYGSTSSTIYIDTFWNRAQYFTIQQFQHAALEYGSFLYTAWVNAGNPSVTAVRTKQSVPQQFVLDQNYPNPFNPSTVIRFSVPSTSFVMLKVYDVTGRQVAVVSNGIYTPGVYVSSFNAGALNLSSGIYFYKLDAVNIVTGSQISITKKLLYVK